MLSANTLISSVNVNDDLDSRDRVWALFSPHFPYKRATQCVNGNTLILSVSVNILMLTVNVKTLTH